MAAGIILLLAIFAVFTMNVESKVCDFPEQFETTLGFQGSVPGSGFIDGIQQIEIKFIYDFPNRRWAVVNMFEYFTGESDYFYWIQDYKNGIISVLRDNVCYREQLNETMRHIEIPDDAVFRGDHDTGAGEEKLAYSEYFFKEGLWNITTYLVKHDAGYCVPMNEVAIENKPAWKAVIHFGYFDFEPRLTDESLFDISEYCAETKPLGNEIRPTGEFRYIRHRVQVPSDPLL